MINIKKGTAHSLQQTDAVAKVVANEGVVAGMVVHIDPTANSNTGGVKKSTSTTAVSATGAAIGFAANDQTDGDVIESGKLGVYLLDGGSIIESDQYVSGLTLTEVALLGKKAVTSATAGKFDIAATETAMDAEIASTPTLRILGTVVSVRTIPTVEVPATASTLGWPTATVIGIKLGA